MWRTTGEYQCDVDKLRKKTALIPTYPAATPAHFNIYFDWKTLFMASNYDFYCRISFEL